MLVSPVNPHVYFLSLDMLHFKSLSMALHFYTFYVNVSLWAWKENLLQRW